MDNNIDKKEEISPVELDRFLNGMNTLFYLFVCVPLLFFVIVYLKLQKEGGFIQQFGQGEVLWHYGLALLGVSLFLPGEILYRKRLNKLAEDLNFKEKLAYFKNASLLKYSFTSIGCTLLVLFLYLISTKVFLVGFGVLLVLFSLGRPTPFRINKDLKLTKAEQKLLREYRRYL